MSKSGGQNSTTDQLNTIPTQTGDKKSVMLNRNDRYVIENQRRGNMHTFLYQMASILKHRALTKQDGRGRDPVRFLGPVQFNVVCPFCFTSTSTSWTLFLRTLWLLWMGRLSQRKDFWTVQYWAGWKSRQGFIEVFFRNGRLYGPQVFEFQRVAGRSSLLPNSLAVNMGEDSWNRLLKDRFMNEVGGLMGETSVSESFA
jgi:hypothetical protein